MLQALWRFSRPHTIIGTSLSVWAIFALVWAVNPATTVTDIKLGLIAWVACILGNVYIVGLNQLWDVEIDQVNKPHLPLASGAFTQAQGRWIVGICGLVSLTIAMGGGWWLAATVGSSLLIGTVYSVPPVRLKRFSFFAALCILVVRGVIVNLGLYLYFSTALLTNAQLSPDIWGLTLFILLFSIGIAIFKDLPDMEGDRQFKIQTLTLQIGKKNVFALTRYLMTLCYVGICGWAIVTLTHVNLPVFIGCHLVILSLFWWRSLSVDLEDKTAIASFYQFIWKLFFVEYFIYPLNCLLLPGFSGLT